jgi:hypothetical protein
MGEWRYRTTSPWPRHYMEVNGQLHAQASLPPRGNIHGTHWTEAGWTQMPVWTRGSENSWSMWTQTPTPSVVQPAASRYIDCAIPESKICFINLCPFAVRSDYTYCRTAELKWVINYKGCGRNGSLFNLVVRIPGYRTEMYCASCEVLTECIYVM